MDIVMLAAGTSSRMGKVNKMLLPCNGLPMVALSCLEALSFLQSWSLENDEPCSLVIVTGYRRLSVGKALEPCRLFIEQTKAKLEMLVVNNSDYRKGQFTSTKTGVAQVHEGRPFFISLADMPLVTAEHYRKLVPLLSGYDAVRPFCENGKDRVPGHPVLHSYKIRKAILESPDDCSVNRVLKAFNVREESFNDRSWSLDIDIPESYRSLTEGT